jgi:predicted dehydrogenase
VTRRFRTAVIGAGRVGANYADDPLTRRYFRYASHAQVLAEHPAFAWEAVVDPDSSALSQAVARWGVRHSAPSMHDLLKQYDPEVLVLATPPTARAATVEACPGLIAVLCEKPLGLTLKDAAAFLNICDARGVRVQVNLWRRCDPLMRKLAAGELRTIVSRPHVVHGIYGNGLLNNGTHLIDLSRMLFGEVVGIRVLGPTLRHAAALPLAGDFDVACQLRFTDGLTAVLQPLDFRNHREVGLDIWGEQGRLEIWNEGLVVQSFARQPHRAVSGASEIAVDAPKPLQSTAGEALFHVYDNLAAALCDAESLQSSGASAWRTAAVVEAIRHAATAGSETEAAVPYDRPAA